jgi:CRP-like cAMP-binding protein
MKAFPPFIFFGLFVGAKSRLSGTGPQNDKDLKDSGTAAKYGVRRVYAAGTELFRQDEPVNDVYLIHTGAVKLTWIASQGDETIQALGDSAISKIGRIVLPLKKKEIAQLIAIEPPTFSRLLRDLSADGLIRLDGEWIPSFLERNASLSFVGIENDLTIYQVRPVNAVEH